MTPPPIKRPIGVVLSAIALGLISLFLLISAMGTVFSAAVVGHMPPTATAPSVPPPPPALMMAVMATIGCGYLLLAAWAISTLVGLVRMKSWARISIMIIGGGLTFIGLIGALSTAALPVILQSTPMPPNANPAMLHIMFAVMAISSLLIATLGIFWLVYFALRRTREAFALASTQPAIASSPALPTYVSYSTTSPLDFSVAQPMEPLQPLEPAQPFIPAETYIPPPTAPKRPISITILAIFFLIGAFCALINLATPFPLFFFGVLLSGWPAHLIVLVLVLWTGVTGTGLLKLQKPAWFMAIAYCALGILNTLVMLLPTSRQHMAVYMDTLSQSMGVPPSPINIFDSKLFDVLLLPGMLFGVLLIVFVIILLWRARSAFEPPPQA